MIRILQILLLLALIWIAWRMLRAFLSSRGGADRRDADRRETPRFEPIARCGKCGTHVPREQLDPAGVCQRCAQRGP